MFAHLIGCWHRHTLGRPGLPVFKAFLLVLCSIVNKQPFAGEKSRFCPMETLRHGRKDAKKPSLNHQSAILFGAPNGQDIVEFISQAKVTLARNHVASSISIFTLLGEITLRLFGAKPKRKWYSNPVLNYQLKLRLKKAIFIYKWQASINCMLETYFAGTDQPAIN